MTEAGSYHKLLQLQIIMQNTCYALTWLLNKPFAFHFFFSFSSQSMSETGSLAKPDILPVISTAIKTRFINEKKYQKAFRGS